MDYARQDKLAPAPVEPAPAWGPPIWAADAKAQPPTDGATSSPWLWTPFRWDPDELRVTVGRAGRRTASRRLTEPAGAAVAARRLPAHQVQRRLVAATMLAILFALAAHLAASGAELAEPAPSYELAEQSAATATCDASSGRLVYVAAVDQCLPAEW
jgi:hypothetical protein